MIIDWIGIAFIAVMFGFAVILLAVVSVIIKMAFFE